jgi:hypothetical protein
MESHLNGSQLDNSCEYFLTNLALFSLDFIHPSSAEYSTLIDCVLLLISLSSPVPSPGVSPPHSGHFPQCAECPLPDADACVQPDLCV